MEASGLRLGSGGVATAERIGNEVRGEESDEEACVVEAEFVHGNGLSVGPSAWCQVRAARCVGPGAWCRVLGARCLGPEPENEVGVRHTKYNILKSIRELDEFTPHFVPHLSHRE